MKKKDYFLDYKASRRNRDKRATISMKKEKSEKKAAVLFVLFLAVLISVIAYVVSLFFIRGKKSEKGQSDYVLYAGDEIEYDMAEPYGLYSMIGEPDQADEIEEIVEEGGFMPDFIDTRTPIKAKGVYLTFEGVTKILNNVLGLLQRTELNTIIIDIKDDDGRITFEMQGEFIDRIGTSQGFIQDIDETMKVLKDNDIYVIARIVSFRDPLLGDKRPDLALHMKDGTLYRDYSNMVWLNPLNQEVLDYLIEIAANCAEAGFDEVNFDYIRFPTDGKISEIDLSDGGDDITKIDAITAAVKYLCENIKPMGLYVSADVFGGIITSLPDQRNVGQDYVQLSRYLDYICPMVYPSHYANGYYGVEYPDTQPYKIMYSALTDSVRVLSEIDEEIEHKAIVRPWLQDFTASYLKNYIKYGATEVRAQIDAVYDAGYEEWFLWNASMRYTEGALMTEAEAEYAYNNREKSMPAKEPQETTEEIMAPKVKNRKYYISPWRAEG